MLAAQFKRKEDYQAFYKKEEVVEQYPSSVREADELIYITAGGAECWLENAFYRVHEGDILIVPAGVMLGANLKLKSGSFAWYSVSINNRFLEFLKMQDEQVDYCLKLVKEKNKYLLRLPIDISASLREDFAEVESELNDDKLNSELSSGAKLSMLLVKVNRIIGQYEETSLLRHTENRLGEVISYIQEHCTESISVEDLAKRFSYSSSHLAHSFKKQMGISLYHYVLLCRLRIGREAMMQNVPVKEAYLRCGFGDYAGFYRAFTKEFGISPQKYKRKFQR